MPFPEVDHLYSLFMAGGDARPGVRRFHLLYAGPDRLTRSTNLNDVFEDLASDLQLYVAAGAHERVFVHAGVVGWDGQAIIMPGRSMAGKTSLVSALVRAGATYYSDEYAVFDSQGYVHPFPKPLNLRTESHGYSRRQAVETLGGVIGRTPLPVGLVVVAEYQPGAQWRPRRLSPGQAALALLAHTVAARQQPAAALALLQRVVSHAVTFKGVRGEAVALADTLLSYATAMHSLHMTSPHEAGGRPYDIQDALCS